MTAVEYPPGTVAVATVRGVENTRVMRIGGDHRSDGFWVTGRRGSAVVEDSDIDTDIRPLIVLDPADPSVEIFLRGDLGPGWSDVQDQMREQTGPQKPREPSNRYAVVLDSEGTEWLRSNDGVWCYSTGQWVVRDWNRIDVVRVLSEGVAP